RLLSHSGGPDLLVGTLNRGGLRTPQAGPHGERQSHVPFCWIPALLATPWRQSSIPAANQDLRCRKPRLSSECQFARDLRGSLSSFRWPLHLPPRALDSLSPPSRSCTDCSYHVRAWKNST